MTVRNYFYNSQISRRGFLGLGVSAVAATLLAGCSTTSTSSSTSGSSSSSSSSSSSKAATSTFNVSPTGDTNSGTVTYNIDMTGYDTGKKVCVWLPIAQTNDYQTIKNVTYNAAGSAKTELNTDEHGNQMVYIEWDSSATTSERTATASFHVDRVEVKRPTFAEKTGEVGSDLDQYLEATSLAPLDGEVKTQADAIVSGKTTTLDKARAIYDWIIANMNRDESVTGCGTGDVCTLLDSKGGKCTDLNSVFVALCRAVGIPAREMFGVRINAEDITKNQHCWAEFYLDGQGWIEADPADVLKAVLTNSWSKDSAECKEKQEYYWGNNDNKRVELSQGRDLTLSPAQSAGALNNFGYPYAEVDGAAINYYKPTDFIYTIGFAEDK